jgi:hypothetical protein
VVVLRSVCFASLDDTCLTLSCLLADILHAAVIGLSCSCCRTACWTHYLLPFWTNY